MMDETRGTARERVAAYREACAARIRAAHRTAGDRRVLVEVEGDFVGAWAETSVGPGRVSATRDVTTDRGPAPMACLVECDGGAVLTRHGIPGDYDPWEQTA